MKRLLLSLLCGVCVLGSGEVIASPTGQQAHAIFSLQFEVLGNKITVSNPQGPTVYSGVIDESTLSTIISQFLQTKLGQFVKQQKPSTPIQSPKKKGTTVDQVPSQPVVTTMHITSKAQFLQIEEAQAKSIKSITFEGFEIDNEFASHFDLVMYHHVDNLTFQNCTFTDGFSFSELFDSEYSVVNLSIVNCGITVYDASEILSRIYPHLIKSVDFSGNGFQEQENLFQKEVIKKEITGRMCLDKLIY